MSFSLRGSSAQNGGGMQSVLLSNIVYLHMRGLVVQNGRLINNRPVGTTGIQEAAMIRKQEHEAKKVGMIVKAIDIAEMKKNFTAKFM